MDIEAPYDLSIVGAGPVGLYAAYYAGFRRLKTVVLDGLPQVGGQISTMYPEKLIHDVAGFSSIKGAELVSNLFEQSKRQNYDLLLSESVSSLTPLGSDYRLTTESGRSLVTKSVVIAGGLGCCQPRTLPVLEGVVSENIMHFVPDQIGRAHV